MSTLEYFDLFGSLSHGGPYKITVVLSVRLSVRHFSQEWLISFFLFLARWQLIGILNLTLMLILKLTEPFFPGKFIFTQIWAKRAQNGTKIGFFDILKNLVISFSWKQPKMKANIIIDISPSIPYLGKTLVLELQAKMLSANQIVGFFKM